MSRALIFVFALAVALGLAWLFLSGSSGSVASGASVAPEESPPIETDNLERAYFAGGCFWCTESDFESVEGVIDARSGYTGGHVDEPTYEQVSAGGTGHAESIEVLYDPARVSYDRLLDVFWHSVDPTDAGGQFCDRGSSYRSAVFAASDAQLEAARASKSALEKTKPFDAPIVTEITRLERFWPAEDYHQDFYKKNPLRYKFYRTGCGRDARVKKLWGDQAYHH